MIAGLLSLAVNGGGQFYNNQFWPKGAIMFGLNALFLAGYLADQAADTTIYRWIGLGLVMGVKGWSILDAVNNASDRPLASFPAPIPSPPAIGLRVEVFRLDF